MKLYHGTNKEIKVVDLSLSRDTVDFGKGFYLTDDYEKSCDWAKNVSKTRGGVAIINVFDWEEDTSLNVKTFKRADYEWLDYVAENRRGNGLDDYDVVIGPIADDAAYATVFQYLNGDITQSQALILLKSYVLPYQYVFKTEQALNTLHFEISGVV